MKKPEVENLVPDSLYRNTLFSKKRFQNMGILKILFKGNSKKSVSG
jgi:hypothetical protein